MAVSALGRDPATSASPPVLAKGTTSAETTNIFKFLSSITSIYLHHHLSAPKNNKQMSLNIYVLEYGNNSDFIPMVLLTHSYPQKTYNLYDNYKY